MTDPRDNDRQTVIGGTNPVIPQVWRLAEPLCRAEGMELVHVAFQREPGGRTLRLYLDKPGGVTLGDCATVSRQLSDLLDVGLALEGAYRLEVSSPGEQRPLGRLSDFERFQGCRARVRIARPINGRKNFTGTLQGVRGPAIQMVVDNQVVDIVFAEIVKAHLIQPNGENPC
ncbi:ribosome maturation factor RimP [Desulfatitalea alkaliphila]|uniref:Ribosome maturation factor RimP n=1 Tax=Desulfatitalea alkaliphila TaxID=2929485 RepID=A0AA41UJH8_9BACT|nr:ribosome maturation factor RimP [Desulfatitalea alkaliphila]MCJ8501149.1 ribosome maturation factor RimP [Desulfatitalea alkaliphila]